MHAPPSLQALALLALVASASAISVTSPSQGETWSAAGPNVVRWNEVSTDPTTFAVTLVQQGVFKQTLADNVDGSQGSLTVTASLPVGTTYQVNIVKSSQDLNTILAQSPQFNITQAGGGSSTPATVSSTGTGTGTGTPSRAGTPTTSGGAASAVGTDIPNASSTSSNATASHSNAAAPVAPHHGGVMGVLALLGLALV